MTTVFAALTSCILLAVAFFAYSTGMAATSYFGLALVLTAYVAIRSHKQRTPELALQGE